MSSKQEESNLNESGENVITLTDALEAQELLEDESTAVLGGSDAKCCSFVKGYIKRQALYSCLTCCPESKEDFTKSAGICLACTYQCHQDHELIELYTKRNFRCDCSTEKIPQNQCNFVEQSGEGGKEIRKKNPINEENNYNQNFSGVYCICKRPYPDPDDSVEDDMIQCIICEDWYHTRHLESTPQKSEKYAEMICGPCMNEKSFLQDYIGIAVNQEDFNEIIDVANVAVSSNSGSSAVFGGSVSDGSVSGGSNGGVGDDDRLKTELDKSISHIMNISHSSAPEDDNDEETMEPKEPSKKRIKLDIPNRDCIKLKMKMKNNNYKKGAVYWPEHWREKLCTCTECKQMYVNLNVLFLLDPEDSIQFYEANGYKKAEMDYERSIEALSSMDHVSKVNIITEFNNMTEKLKEFLHPFVVNKKVVTEEDVNTFFQRMKNEKNEKNSNVQVPHFCR